jgi:predicted porin
MNLKRKLTVLALILSSGILSLHSQPAAVQQLQNNQISRQLEVPSPNLAPGTNAPELYRGENEDVGPQRILRLKPRPTYFDVVLDSQVFFSDNANYAQAPASISSPVFVNTVQAAFAPASVQLGQGKAAAAIGFAAQWYNYGDNRLQTLDFNAQTLFISGKYTLDKWQFGVGVNLTRLVNQANYDETYREFMPNFGVMRVLPLNDRMFFSVGDLVDYHLTEVPSVLGSRTDINDRFDNIASLTFTWQLTSHLIVQPYYRFQYSYYQHNTLATSDRNDCLQSFGFTAAYYFNKNISARVFWNYSRKQSDDNFTPAYHEMNGGLGLTLDIKF